MNITIIVSDGAVYKDGLCRSKLSWQGTPNNVRVLQWQDAKGWLEFSDGSVNLEITTLPSWVNNALSAWTTAGTPQPDPTPTAESNKEYAIAMLGLTDWATIPDVADPAKSNPYLTNADAFVSYRNQIRAVAINPTNGTFTWPTMPNAIWSS
jgi:hypothetical protein